MGEVGASVGEVGVSVGVVGEVGEVGCWSDFNFNDMVCVVVLSAADRVRIQNGSKKFFYLIERCLSSQPHVF